MCRHQKLSGTLWTSGWQVSKQRILSRTQLRVGFSEVFSSPLDVFYLNHIFLRHIWHSFSNWPVYFSICHARVHVSTSSAKFHKLLMNNRWSRISKEISGKMDDIQTFKPICLTYGTHSHLIWYSCGETLMSHAKNWPSGWNEYNCSLVSAILFTILWTICLWRSHVNNLVQCVSNETSLNQSSSI